MNSSLLIFLTILVSIQCQSIKCGVRRKDLDTQSAPLEDSVEKETFVRFGEYPWVVSVLKKEFYKGDQIKIYQCIGSMIHPQIILTSASCVFANENQFVIRAGEWDVQTKSEVLEHQEQDVSKIVIHPEYNSESVLNDVALLVLNEPFHLMEHINPVCLPSQDEILENSECIVSGWGTGGFGERRKYLTILKQVKLPIVQREDCVQRVGQNFNVSEAFICAGGELEPKKCLSDIGGALVCPIPGKNDEFYQRGIVAWGLGCGNTDIPIVYHNVASYRNWIDNEVQKLNFSTTSYTY